MQRAWDTVLSPSIDPDSELSLAFPTQAELIVERPQEGAACDCDCRRRKHATVDICRRGRCRLQTNSFVPCKSLPSPATYLEHVCPGVWGSETGAGWEAFLDGLP